MQSVVGDAVVAPRLLVCGGKASQRRGSAIVLVDGQLLKRSSRTVLASNSLITTPCTGFGTKNLRYVQWKT